MSSSHGGESGRWMVSYADFVTLLFVLFVILYSMGQTDVQKYKQLAQSFQAAFAIGGSPSLVVDPSINQASGGAGQQNGEPSPITIEGLPLQIDSGADVASELSQLLDESNIPGEVSIENNVEGVLIALNEKLLFSPGTIDLQPEAYPTLEAVAAMVRSLDNDIKVVGHTDNTLPVDAAYSNNWNLSMARAYVIVQLLIDKGIDPRRLIASGRGEFDPIHSNDTPEQRVLNNRAEIILIYPQDVQDVINLNIP